MSPRPVLRSALAPAAALAAALALSLVLSLVLTGCGTPNPIDRVEAPDAGACRSLSPADLTQHSNASPGVACAGPHTAETFAVGPVTGAASEAAWDSPELADFAYQQCSTAFADFLGADDSQVLRTILTWVWFRPSRDAWDNGARWYRCDVVGGGAQSQTLMSLPTTVRGALLKESPDAFMACVNGPSVKGGRKVPCDQPHNWRAVTVIKVGEPADPYPGDAQVEAKTRDYCTKSVAAWSSYPVTYQVAYTFFGEAEWEAGIRRSICWAETER